MALILCTDQITHYCACSALKQLMSFLTYVTILFFSIKVLALNKKIFYMGIGQSAGEFFHNKNLARFFRESRNHNYLCPFWRALQQHSSPAREKMMRSRAHAGEIRHLVKSETD